MTFLRHLCDRPAIHLVISAALLLAAWALPGPTIPILLLLPPLAYLLSAARSLDTALARPAAVEARLAAGAMPWEALTLSERGPSSALSGAAITCVVWVFTSSSSPLTFSTPSPSPATRPWIILLVVCAALLGRLIAMLRCFVGNRLVDRLPSRL